MHLVDVSYSTASCTSTYKRIQIPRFVQLGSGLTSVTVTGSETLPARQPPQRLRVTGQALQHGGPQEQTHRQPFWQNVVQQPRSPPHKWLRAELDSARGSVQADISTPSNMGCLHGTSDTDWVNGQYEHGSGLHQPAAGATPGMDAGRQSIGQQPALPAQQSPMQLAAQHPALAAQQPDWHLRFGAGQQPHLARTGLDARQQQGIWQDAPRDTWQQPTSSAAADRWQQPTSSAGADRWQMHESTQAAVRPQPLTAQAPPLQVQAQRPSILSQRPVLHPTLKGTASAAGPAAAGGVYTSNSSAALTPAAATASPAQVSLAAQQAQKGQPDMVTGQQQHVLMCKQDCHPWHLQQQHQPQQQQHQQLQQPQQQQQLHQTARQLQQPQLPSSLAQPYVSEVGQKALTPIARSSGGPGLSFGQCIAFQHVGGASPTSAHAAASPVQGKPVARKCCVSVQVESIVHHSLLHT